MERGKLSWEGQPFGVWGILLCDGLHEEEVVSSCDVLVLTSEEIRLPSYYKPDQ